MTQTDFIDLCVKIDSLDPRDPMFGWLLSMASAARVEGADEDWKRGALRKVFANMEDA